MDCTVPRGYIHAFYFVNFCVDKSSIMGTNYLWLHGLKTSGNSSRLINHRCECNFMVLYKRYGRLCCFDQMGMDCSLNDNSRKEIGISGWLHFCFRSGQTAVHPPITVTRGPRPHILCDWVKQTSVLYWQNNSLTWW